MPKDPSKTVSYQSFAPSSERASAAARGSSRKSGTRPEILLRQKLWAAGCRFRVDVGGLPGRPDIVFSRVKIAIFCDGDFWHGRNWEDRRRKLARGSNASYWVRKIERNMERDRQRDLELVRAGWTVMRFWESQILESTNDVLEIVLHELRQRGHFKNRALEKRLASNGQVSSGQKSGEEHGEISGRSARS